MSQGGHEPMAAVDAFWLNAETPENRMIINGILALDGVLEMGDLVKTVQDGLLGFDRFRRPVEREDGHPSWGPELDFLPEGHFETRQLPLGSSEPERDLQALVSELLSRPLREDQPLWHTYLVQGHPRGSVVVIRVHHCIADGIALVYVLLSMAHAKPDAGPPPPQAAPHGSSATGFDWVREKLEHTSERLHQGWHLLEHLNPQHLLRKGHDLSAAIGKLTTMSAQDHPVLKGRLGTEKAVAWTEPLDLSRIKALAKRADAKINDVLVAMATGGLRRYIASRGQPVDGEILRATVPVNLRPLSQAHELGNRFGLVFLDLPIYEASPRARLAAVRESMNKIKGGAEAVVSYGLLRAIGAGPEALEEQAVDLFSSKTSLILTNVPGPRTPLTFAGRPVRRIMFWVPQSGSVSLGLSIISYVDHVMVGVQVDKGLVPDPFAVAEAMADELDVLEQALAG